MDDATGGGAHDHTRFSAWLPYYSEDDAGV
jgi:hypothetical protein